MTGHVVVTIILSVVFLAFFLEMTICRLVADRHRRRVPEGAWEAAGVDRLFWGFLGINIYVPFSNLYYLAKMRDRLDKAGELQRRSSSV